MQQIEQTLDGLFGKKAPFQLPENARQILVKVLPWLALIGGVLIIFSAWNIYQGLTVLNNLSGWANGLGATLGAGMYQPTGISPLLWLSLIILIVEGVLYFVAFPALQTFQKRGWDILLWVALVNAVQAIVQTIAYSGYYFDIGGLFWALLSTAIGLYLLFQIRPYYTGEKKLAPTPATGATMSVPKETPAEPVEKPADKPIEKPEKKA